jgi:hypothetical protein
MGIAKCSAKNYSSRNPRTIKSKELAMKFVALVLVALASITICQTELIAAQSADKPAMAATADATATLVIYRPKRFYGSGLTPSVYINGEEIARMDNGRYFVVTVKPSTLKITSSMKHDPLPVEAKAGKVEYLEMAIMTGTWKGGGRLIPTPAGEAQEALKKLKPLDQKWAKSPQVSFVLPGESTAAEAK